FHPGRSKRSAGRSGGLSDLHGDPDGKRTGTDKKERGRKGITMKSGDMEEILKREKKSWKKGISQTQFIAYGFFCVIMAGTLLLMLPAASRDGQCAGFLECLFTATSASCV